jgi:small subunit ribosomal protein S8
MSSVSDPIADFLTRLRNAKNAAKPEVCIPHSKMKAEIARILKDEGFVQSVDVDRSGSFPQLRIALSYRGSRPVITDLQRVSRPGLRRYVGASEIPKVLSGIGISILSTSSGVMSSREARRKNVGGEVLAFVW